MLAIRLDKNIDCSRLCKDIDSMIGKYKQTISSQDLSGALLIINIKTSTDCTSNYHILKLENKEL
jgi:hypothetical protein